MPAQFVFSLTWNPASHILVDISQSPRIPHSPGSLIASSMPPTCLKADFLRIHSRVGDESIGS